MKHPSAFKPIDTFSSSQRPPPVRDIDHHVEYLGDSSSLFDEDYNQPLHSSPPPLRDTHWGNRKNRDTSGDIQKQDFLRGNMVREREPPVPQPRPEQRVEKPLPNLGNTAPEFGKASPLRNPLKKDTNSQVFNVPRPGQARPEHHRDTNRIALLHPPAEPPHPKVRYSNASSVDSDIFEIPASQFSSRPPAQAIPLPYNAPFQPIQPPPRPVFSSMGHANGFQPVNNGFQNPYHAARKTVILDDVAPKRQLNEDEDDFDPDAEIRAEGDQFGAPDLYGYVDHAKANENIKALLEGAFDEDKIPRTRGRKKKKQREEDDKTKSLADRLQALEIKKDEKAAAEENEEEDDDAEDDGTVDGMKVKLLPHQVEGVAWMIEKETGAHNKRAKLPKGGILADDMGLGKTVQSIALILSNPRPEKGVEPENKKNKILPTVGKGTLIVAPLALIKQWEGEVKDKITKSHSLKVLVHHGPNRTKSIDKLKSYDVVVTTYQVLTSEHKACGEGADGLKKGCFGVHWYRVILDEAHSIKNRSAQMTKACYELRSHYRWCLTGTPMQNNLDELQSLIKFLRIQPYSDISSWKESISGPMKNGKGNLAMRRLQIFLKACMKRRTKEVLKKDGALNFGGKNAEGDKKAAFRIVARNVENVIGEFTPEERQFYDRLLSRAESRLAEMMGGEKQDYIGALVLLLRLRQACNHPQLVKSNVKDDKDALTTGSKSSAQSQLQTPRKAKNNDADDLADLLGGLSVQTKRCDICQNALNRDNAASGAIRCNDCETDLNASVKKSKKLKKHKKKSKSKETVKEETQVPKSSRNRRIIVDSDDEEEEGEWLVPEDEQDTPDLGQAGGTDDENAEGGGDTLNTVDSESSESENEDTVGSFVVHDTDSEGEAPIARKKKQPKNPKVITIASDDESGVDDDAEDSGSEADSEEEADEDESESEYESSEFKPSTKIRQLLAILENETPDHKVIVFSQFTSMLDLIEPFLRREAYGFTRYDGGMRNDLREASLDKLRNDKRTRVLLCSLKCGSLGLNLTCASRVVIMEPFWNPVSNFFFSLTVYNPHDR